MAKKQYRYLPLTGAKLVGRRHDRDVDPPGMKELKNAFVSKSDSAITARPDFNPIVEDLFSIDSEMMLEDLADSDNYLNSATGMYGTGNIIWLSRMAPISSNGTEYVLACSTYSTGLISISNGSTSLVGSSETRWVKEVWPGCILRVQDGDTYYRIESVNGDSSITISTEFEETTKTNASYAIFRTHQFDHADYKLNLQPFTSGMIYSCPTVTMPVNSNSICGPFYASVVETNTDNTWVEVVDDDDMGVVNYPAAGRRIQMCATSGSAWMAFVGVDSGGDNILTYSTSPADDWELVSGPDNFDMSGCVIYNNGYFYVSGRNTATNKMSIAYSVNGSGWTKKDHPTIDDTAVAMAGNGGSTIVVGLDGSSFPAAVYYSTNNFDDWNEAVISPAATGSSENIKYCGSTFINIGSSTSHYSSDGISWSRVGSQGISMPYYNDVDYSTSGNYWMFVGGNTPSTSCIKFDDLSESGTYVETTTGESPESILWIGDKFLCANGDVSIYSTADCLSFDEEFSTSFSTTGNGFVFSGAYSTSSQEAVFPITGNGVTDYPQYAISNQTQTTTTWRQGIFEPLSDEYRSLSHSVIDGYVVLIGTREYQTASNTWEYFPRRIRWTVPLTYNNFSDIGSGTADLDGSGALLDSRTVNGRIVTFESSSIGAISPRGYSSDPWEYDKIKDNIRSISNPVVVDDMCYFIDDSGLLRATNGISVESPPFSFDLTEYDDFNSDKPVWLTYSPELESLCIYNPSDENGYIYFVETEQGTVTRFQVPALDLGGASAERPKSVVCVENSDDRRMMVSYNPDGSADGDGTKLLISELSTGDTITGVDEWTTNASDDTYHNVDVQTPQIFVVPEGNKTGIKHLIVNTYTDGTDVDTNPILVVQCKSLEDTAWHDNGDRNGTITVTDAACTGDGTAWSSTIGASGGTVYDTPCLATQARVYVGSTLQTLGTEYTITDTKEITFGSATGDTVYAYWENQPEVVANAGDMIQTTEGWHRVSSFDTASTATLDHYLTTGTDATATHHHGTPFPVGEGQIKIGISKLVEGVKLRFLIFHRADGDATVTKITGVSVGHIPAGEKIVEP